MVASELQPPRAAQQPRFICIICRLRLSGQELKNSVAVAVATRRPEALFSRHLAGVK